MTLFLRLLTTGPPSVGASHHAPSSAGGASSSPPGGPPVRSLPLLSLFFPLESRRIGTCRPQAAWSKWPSPRVVVPTSHVPCQPWPSPPHSRVDRRSFLSFTVHGCPDRPPGRTPLDWSEVVCWVDWK
eukprot:scaffold287_cov337-Pavlova_lutheri.AAC.45